MLYHTMACCSFWKMPCPKCRSSTSSHHTQKEIHRGHFFQDWSLSNIWVILQDGAEFCAVFITKNILCGLNTFSWTSFIASAPLEGTILCCSTPWFSVPLGQCIGPCATVVLLSTIFKRKYTWVAPSTLICPAIGFCG